MGTERLLRVATHDVVSIVGALRGKLLGWTRSRWKAVGNVASYCLAAFVFYAPMGGCSTALVLGVPHNRHTRCYTVLPKS